MEEFLAVVFTGLVAFMAGHYTLTVATVKEPVKSVVSAVFAVILIIVAGALALMEVVS